MCVCFPDWRVSVSVKRRVSAESRFLRWRLFSEEMNLAMIHQFSIRYLVTKASGAHSGFQEKLAAAQKAGITACVIGKQEQEQGMSYAQVTETLSRLLGHTISGRPEVEISLIGIGMSAATLTQEAKKSAGRV